MASNLTLVVAGPLSGPAATCSGSQAALWAKGLTQWRDRHAPGRGVRGGGVQADHFHDHRSGAGGDGRVAEPAAGPGIPCNLHGLCEREFATARSRTARSMSAWPGQSAGPGRSSGYGRRARRRRGREVAWSASAAARPTRPTAIPRPGHARSAAEPAPRPPRRLSHLSQVCLVFIKSYTAKIYSSGWKSG